MRLRFKWRDYMQIEKLHRYDSVHAELTSSLLFGWRTRTTCLPSSLNALRIENDQFEQ